MDPVCATILVSPLVFLGTVEVRLVSSLHFAAFCLQA
jgi:hypothetical protein